MQPDERRTSRSHAVLWVDAWAALASGIVVSLFATKLTSLYGLPAHVLERMGAVSLAYAAYGFGVVRGRWLPRWRVRLLIVANTAWACVCIAIAISHRESVGIVGTALLTTESAFVLALAMLEARNLPAR